jgi:hypothetical protein
MRFTWIPGINPVQIPKIIPAKIARENSMNIIY